MAFYSLDKAQILTLTDQRPGETKIGEHIACIRSIGGKLDFTQLDEKLKYIIIGIEEDIGVRANYGRPGAKKAFQSFLNTFLNQQDNEYIPAETIALGGYFNFETIGSIDHLRRKVSQIDLEVFDILYQIHKEGLVPIVIGGGHNNAYPCIRSLYESKKIPIAILNFDAHTDLREKSGRHSGNPFRYALDEGMIHQYLILGLLEAYTSQEIYHLISQDDRLDYVSYEALKLRKSHDLNTEIKQWYKYAQHRPYGIELDLDVLAMFPSSAMSPIGLSIEDVLHGLSSISTRSQYIHICEGAPTLNQEGHRIVGRTISTIINMYISQNSL